MKKTLVYGVATAAVLASFGAGFGLAQCSSQPTVYGPPTIIESSSSSEADKPVKDDGEPSTGTGGSESSSERSGSESEEAIATVYGPPPE